MRTNRESLGETQGEGLGGTVHAMDARPPMLAACQKELAKPTPTKFRTEMLRITPRGKHLVVIAVKARKEEEQGHFNSC